MARLKEDVRRGRRIEERMDELGSTDTMVGEELPGNPNTNRTLVWGWRHGKGMDTTSLDALAKALRSTPEWLRSGRGEKELSEPTTGEFLDHLLEEAEEDDDRGEGEARGGRP
jgi:hypothetical protein